MTRRLLLLPMVGWAVVLGGCSGLLTSDQPAEHEYWLEAVALQLGEASTESRPDLVVAVRAIPGLDTDRILVKGPGARLNHYAGARWPDHLPEVLAVAVRLSLESSGRFNRVSGGSKGRNADWSLDLELRKFFAVVTTAGAPGQVHVELAGHLECGSDAAAVTAAAMVPARTDSLDAIIAAFQRATDGAMVDIGQQLESRCLAQPAMQSGQQ